MRVLYFNKAILKNCQGLKKKGSALVVATGMCLCTARSLSDRGESCGLKSIPIFSPEPMLPRAAPSQCPKGSEAGCCREMWPSQGLPLAFLELSENCTAPETFPSFLPPSLLSLLPSFLLSLLQGGQNTALKKKWVSGHEGDCSRLKD